MSTAYHRFVEPWAITLEGALAWQSVFKYEGPAAVAADRDFFGNTKPKPTVVDGISIIPFNGPMIRSAGFLERAFGAISHEDLTAWLDAAESDPAVKAILFDVNSPGGTVNGSPELFTRIAAGRKPTYAFTAGTMASAAYWAVAGAKRILATESASVGSVGAIMSVTNLSRALSNEGVDVAVFSSGVFKAAGHYAKPLTGEHAGMFQERVDQAAAMFKSAIAKHRRNVKADAMEGQVFFGPEAKARGLVDELVSGLPAALAHVQGQLTPSRPSTPPAPTRAQVRAALEAKGDFVAVWNLFPEARADFASVESFTAYSRAIKEGRASVTAPRAIRTYRSAEDIQN